MWLYASFILFYDSLLFASFGKIIASFCLFVTTKKLIFFFVFLKEKTNYLMKILTYMEGKPENKKCSKFHGKYFFNFKISIRDIKFILFIKIYIKCYINLIWNVSGCQMLVYQIFITKFFYQIIYSVGCRSSEMSPRRQTKMKLFAKLKIQCLPPNRYNFFFAKNFNQFFFSIFICQIW